MSYPLTRLLWTELEKITNTWQEYETGSFVSLGFNLSYRKINQDGL